MSGMRSIRTSVRERAPRPIRPRVRVTGRVRRPSEQEQRQIEARLRREGKI
jgi:hypothetical protein